MAAAHAENYSNAAPGVSKLSNETPRFRARQRGIATPLVDHGDYYFHPDGRKIQFFRKQDVYVVKADWQHLEGAMGRVKSHFGDRIQKVRTHRLGGQTVVRVTGARSKREKSSPDQKITPAMIKSSDNSISRVQPIFANSRGQGDILLLPKLTLKLKPGVDTARAKTTLANRYGLEFERKLKLSGNVYSYALKNKLLGESQQFALIRSLMNDSLVAWAEPQFISQPYKTAYEPNDTLYTQQRHLQNTGLGGSRCDTDCDANNAWDIDTDNAGGGDQGLGAVAGEGMVIAIIDDGVQLDHPDLDIWTNPGETLNGNDDDGNGYDDDVNGWDFVDDRVDNPGLQNAAAGGAGTCSSGFDGETGQDNDPSPQAFSDCLTIEGDDVEQDDHGTAVAGLAAAIGNNNQGVAGTAFRAKILPIRIISAFDDSASASPFCVRIAQAMEYAGRYADVINNSWGMDAPCVALETAITNVTAGTIMDEMVNVSKRKSTDAGSGSPVLFASGNSASGWIKITVPVTAGEHAYEWRFLRSAFPEMFDPGVSYSFAEDNSVWVDDITWPDGSQEGFEGDLSGFNNEIVLNSCNDQCTSFLLPARPVWSIDTQADHVLSGHQSAKIDASDSDCGNIYLHTIREDVGGEISFWVWVSTNTENLSDKFEFLIDGKEKISFGDLPAFVDNAVGYPANLASTIAVGASTSGDLSGLSSASLNLERRVHYSQYGPELDVVAPSSDQHFGITTTDRSGPGEGYNTGAGGDYADAAYTGTFGGTSASTPIVAGAAAAIIAIDGDLDASEVRDILRDTADKIGTNVYDNGGLGRNDFYGYGRLSMLNALQSAAGIALTDPLGDCSNPDPFSYTAATDVVLASYTPQAPFCPAKGAIPVSDDFCFPIKAANGNVALICL